MVNSLVTPYKVFMFWAQKHKKEFPAFNIASVVKTIQRPSRSGRTRKASYLITIQGGNQDKGYVTSNKKFLGC